MASWPGGVAAITLSTEDLAATRRFCQEVFDLPVHVDDVDATREELRSRGVELLTEPVTRPWGPRTASFRDPAGHIWEIAS